MDAFGRLRISDVFTTFNYYPTPLTGATGLDEDTWVNVSAGITSTSYNSANYVAMTVSGSNSHVTRFTKKPMEYLPGKSRLVYLTGVMAYGTLAGNTFTARAGLFNVDSSNPPSVTEGAYFQTDGTNLQWCETTQTETITVNQSSWNIDTFDGRGPSGISLDITNVGTVLLLAIDQEWLGVGNIRCGFVFNNVIYYAHKFSHSGLSTQYTKSPKQRICYQMVGTTITSPLSMRQMCSTNISEGGYFPFGRRVSLATAVTGVPVATIGTKYILLAIKVQSAYPNGTVVPLALSCALSSGTNAYGLYELQMHSTNGSVGATATSGAALSYANVKDSMCMVASGTGAQYVSTDGYILTTGCVSSRSNTGFSSNDFETLLTRAVCTQYDILYLVGTCNTSNGTMCGTIDFIETM